MRFLGGKGGYFEKLSELKIQICRGWGRCLKVTLQTNAPENYRLCRWGDERTVKRTQTVSDDPHWRERNFCNTLSSLYSKSYHKYENNHLYGQMRNKLGLSFAKLRLKIVCLAEAK
jgi:hypothetical protein